MHFTQLDLKNAYDSDEDDVLNDFYVPVLANSKIYLRLAGFFSSSALAVAAKGIVGLIKNQGKMKLIVGAKLRKADIEAIRKGLKTKSEVIEDLILADFDSIESEFVRDHVKALCWMVANQTLEIKVAIPFNQDSLDFENGIYHQKVGLLEDVNTQDKISFSGSINESRTGWIDSVEEFKVFRSWISGENKYVEEDLSKFEKYWNGNAKRLLILDIPKAIHNKMVEMAPDSIEELGLNRHYNIMKIKPWKNQVEAIKKWTNNGCSGILAMATGSGKTFTALLASNLAPINVITIVIVPTIPILLQWAKKEIPRFDKSAEIIMCYGNNPKWKTILPLTLARARREGISYQREKRLYVVVVLQTASKQTFLQQWKGIPDENIQIICDEVHHIGAPKYQNCFELPSSRRIGLSATPERGWDPIGTEKIIDYFGPCVYEYGIKDAIKDGHLSKYTYYPYFAFLTPQEYEEYYNLSLRISSQIAKIKTKKNSESKSEKKQAEELKRSESLKNLLLRRAKIKKKAIEKPKIFSKIINQLKCKPIIVFCEDNEQINNIKRVLEKNAINYGIYTSKMTDNQRRKTLSTFSEGLLDVLLAIRCLDEGLDVPQCKGCIIISSGTNSREFTQRRGRILRKSKTKCIAELNDIIVLPPYNKYDKDKKIRKGIVITELERVHELAEAAENYWEIKNEIRKQLKDFDLEVLAHV